MVGRKKGPRPGHILAVYPMPTLPLWACFNWKAVMMHAPLQNRWASMYMAHTAEPSDSQH